MYTYENELNCPVPTDSELRAVNPILLDILFRRGFKTEAAMRDILFPDMEQALQPLNCRNINAVRTLRLDSVIPGSNKFKSSGRKLTSFLQPVMGSRNMMPLTMPISEDSPLW